MDPVKNPSAWLVHEGLLVTITTEEGQDSTAAIKEETAKRGLKSEDAIPGAPPEDWKKIWESKHASVPPTPVMPLKDTVSTPPSDPVAEANISETSIPPAAVESKPRRRGDNWDRMITGIRATQKWSNK